MREHHYSSATAQQRALRWLQTLPTANRNERAAFISWIRQTPRHLHALFIQKMLQKELQGLDPERRIDVEALIENARARIHPARNVIRWPDLHYPGPTDPPNPPGPRKSQ